MDIRDIISKNLIAYRKQAKLTQQELADQLNYSDKAISKWERGDSIPDVLVLKQIADCYGITLNDLLSDSNTLAPPPAVESVRRKNARHIIISLLSAGLVYLIATLAVVVCGMLDIHIGAQAYVIALPVSAIVLLVFACIWGAVYLKCITVSATVWTCCVCFNVLLMGVTSSWLIYLLGAALQVLTILWCVLVYVTPKHLAKFKKNK